ncbi:MAG: DUF2252 family protein [Polyangiaceae bacterium]
MLLVSGFAALVAGCDGGEDARTAELVNVLAGADEALIRTRPELCAGKYQRMAGDPYSFFRGSLALWLHDLRLDTEGAARSAYALDGPLPLALGDPHPENFGTLEAGDGTLALEPNDFDAADRAPYLNDVRRLTVGLALAARLSNPDDAEAAAAASAAAGEIARSAAASYATEIAAFAGGGARPRYDASGGGAFIEDLFDRAEEDLESREELEELTEVEAGARRLRRGVLDDAEPTAGLADLPGAALQALPQALRDYRLTLLAPPEPAYFTLVDAARDFGSGVASWPRVRALILVRGESDAVEDDVVLEIKELPDSGVAGLYPPGVHADSPEARVLATSRGAWARPDGERLWGTTRWLGLPAQVRREAEAHKTVRLDRMEDAEGTPQALTALATRLGALLARVHASPFEGDGDTGAAAAIAERIGAGGAAFAAEQAELSVRYAALVVADWERFGAALADLGPLLGVEVEPGDVPSPDLQALLGTPFLAPEGP